MTSNGYQLGDLGAELLAPYVEDEFLFLALRLSADREIGDLQPIALTYESDQPMIPIRLTTVATAPDLGVQAWVLGPARPVPTNCLHVQINEALIDWFNGGFNYADVVTQAANEAGGQSFVTDYAGSPAIMEERLYWENRYDLEALRQAKDPQGFVAQMLRQGFPRADSQMQALLRRHIRIPPIVLEEGVLEVVFRGDEEAYREAEESGTLSLIAEQSFYNNMESYRQYKSSIDFDADVFVASLDEVIVTPLCKGQQLFSDYDYLTRLFTTLSADEMTVDPVFDFNPDLEGVVNVRRATARMECPNFDPDDPRFEDIILVVTLADGREIRSNPYAQQDPGDAPLPFGQPAAAVIERMDVRGQPENIRSLATSVDDTADPQQLPEEFELLPNRPNPFNGATVIPLLAPVATRDASLTICATWRVRACAPCLVEAFCPGTARWCGMEPATRETRSAPASTWPGCRPGIGFRPERFYSCSSDRRSVNCRSSGYRSDVRERFRETRSWRSSAPDRRRRRKHRVRGRRRC